MNTRKNFVFGLTIALAISACQKELTPAEKEQAMIEQVQRDNAAEQQFAQDSLNTIRDFQHDSATLAQTFTTDTVDRVTTVQQQYEDDDGDTQSYTRYIVFSKKRKLCEVDAPHYKKAFAGDTLNCQWSDKLTAPEE